MHAYGLAGRVVRAAIFIGLVFGIAAGSTAWGIETRGSSAPSTTAPLACAGDDQVAVVGRRIVLDGSSSSPPGRIGFRWIQTSGPPVETPEGQGEYFGLTFRHPGVYRFLLVTAEGGRISKPDEVEVRVLARWPAADPSGAVSEREERESVVALARRLVEAEVDGVARANPLAGELEGIAARVPLYESYEQLQEELFRRLELILPAGADRSRWESHVFLPLSVRLIETVRARGLDLTGEQGRRQELNPSQREAVAAFFQEAAAGMRAVGPRDAR